MLWLCSGFNLRAQSYDYQNTTLANFLQRHYESQPFEGLREIKDYNNTYLECVLAIDKARENEQNISRILFLKASRMVSEYENGVRVIETITTSENDTIKPSPSVSTVITTSGITGRLSLLTSFYHQDKLVYVYLKKT